MTTIFALVQFTAGLALVVFFKPIVTLTSKAQAKQAALSDSPLLKRIKWESAYMMMIARIGTIFAGIILMLSAYATAFGTIDLAPGAPATITATSSTT